MTHRLCLIALCLIILLPGPSHAQAVRRIDVFVEQDPDTGSAAVYFQDALSGLSATVTASRGRGFTLLGDYVLYEDPLTGLIMRATSDGILEEHPFIRRTADIRTIRWVVSPDGQAVAWVQVSMSGTSEAYIAWADGRDLRQLPIPSPEAPYQLEPVALTNGMTRFFYDAAHPAEPVVPTPYTIYENLNEYSIADETFLPLSQEPNCSCSAAFSADGRIFARLEAAAGLGPFVLHVWDLTVTADITIPTPDLPYPWGGDPLINSDGTLVAYSVARADSDPEGAGYGLVLVDVVAKEQNLILSLGPIRYRPLAFIDEDSALLLVGAGTDGGTYKLSLIDGTIQPVARAIYLGMFSQDTAS